MFWVFMYFSLGLTLAYMFPLGYFFVLVGTTYYLYKTKNFDVALYIYTFFILIVPFLLQMSLGGFVNSGAVILWSLLAPTGALFFKGRKAGIIWFSLFVLLCIISVVAKDIFHQNISLSENTINFFFLMNVGVVSGFLFYTLVYFRQLTTKQHQQLEQNYLNLEAQKRTIEMHRKDIIDSINYAKRIQDAILPPLDFIEDKLPNSFILYKPKDIVAGDFYWMELQNDIIFIAVADCTGHGVPGAMVSLVCCNALKRAVKEFGLTNTGKILDKVTELVIETFENSQSGINDGMDISLLAYDTVKKEINWSGANNPLWYIQDEQLIKTKADKQPIGKYVTQKPFTQHTIPYKDNTLLYLFTDGLPDQFGGPEDKKFMTKRLEEVILKNSHLAMPEQKEKIENAFNDWKGSSEQIDDVCVIGLRL